MAPDAAAPNGAQSSVAACAGRSGSPTLHACAAPPLYVTTQKNGKNPKYACGRHIAWLLRYRTVPGSALIVTRLGGTA